MMSKSHKQVHMIVLLWRLLLTQSCDVCVYFDGEQPPKLPLSPGGIQAPLGLHESSFQTACLVFQVSRFYSSPQTNILWFIARATEFTTLF